MAENINGSSLLSSGGHQWHWDGPAAMRKVITTAGVKGSWGFLTAVGPRRGRVVGAMPGGGPALLIATGASRAAADAALSALESPIEALIESGGAGVTWEDDAGHSGSRLVLLAYMRMGPRLYGMTGSTHSAWQAYVLELVELSGA